MRYVSTRGGVGELSFEQALFSGYANDGGLLVPVSVPTVDAETLRTWSTLSYVELAKRIVPMFIGEDEIPRSDLLGLVDKSFGKFQLAGVVDIARLNGGLNVLELFHGPTMAFKDLALSFVGQMYGYFLSKRKTHSIILVGTSGDTGSSAIEAVKDQPWIDVIVLLPRGRCTRTQELQMTTAIADNVHVFRVDGTSDDLDVPIRNCFVDVAFSTRHGLCSINSINWARILVQIVHYFYAYLQMRPDCHGCVEIVVPTGACGNVAAGCIAVKMGLPVKLVCCVNANDVVARLLDTGTYSVVGSVVQSLASAMDIQMAYNLERLFWLFADADKECVCRLMTRFEQHGSVSLPQTMRRRILETISGHRVTDDDIKQTMRRCYEQNEYLVCPHTATAVHYHYQAADRQRDAPVTSSSPPRVCVATASPAKFKEAVVAAGLRPVTSSVLDELDRKPTKFMEMERGEDWTALLKDYIEKLCAKRCP